MKKLLALLSVGLTMAVMTGCGLSPVGSPTIEIDAISSIALPATGSTYTTVSGSIDADTAITEINYSILTSSDQPVSISQISVTGPSANFEEELDFDDYPITITVYSTAAAPATYKLKISVTAGPTAEMTKDFSVTGVSASVSEKTSISMGAENAAPPSLLDADNMTLASRTITDETRRGQIDAIFSFSTVLDPDALAFTSPDVAAGSPYDTWTSKAHTEFKLAPGGTTWASLTNQATINTAWGSGSGASRLPVSQGNIIIILTSAGVYKAVQIVSITGSGSTATMTVNGKY
jgi:hypothetical protein